MLSSYARGGGGGGGAVGVVVVVWGGWDCKLSIVGRLRKHKLCKPECEPNE